jgi:hypothetical protein
MITKVQTASGFRYVGIKEEAERLGVNRIHLWQVLSGKRQSARLMKRVRIKEAK